MKLSRDVLLKFAEAVASSDATSEDMSGIAKVISAIAGPGISSAATYATNKMNDAVEQESRIGDIFAEFAGRKMNEERPRFITYAESNPRAYGPLIAEKKLPEIFEALAHYPASMAYSTPGSPAPQEMLDSIAASVHAGLRDEAFDKIPQDLTAGLSDAEIEKIKNSVSVDDLKPWMQRKFGIDEVASIATPRNNLNSMAHEFGHISDLNKIDNLGEILEKVIPGAHSGLHSAVGALAGPASSFLNDNVPAFSRYRNKLLQDSPIVATLLDNTLGGSMPGMATGLLGSSQTARDLVRKVLPFDATNDAMDFVEEHPVATAVSGFIPQVVNEAYTGIPGYNLIKEFYSKLNSMDASKLTPGMLRDLGPYAKNLGGFKPELEALKFLGHNALSNLTYIAPPLIAAAVAYLNAPKKDETV